MQQELKQQKSGDEISLATALENVKIHSSSIEEVKQVLKLIMVKIGLRSANWPIEEDKLVLIEHIVSKYGNHTCEEIKLAFDLALEGRLTVEANCYENFSCLYFSGIMNAYREWAKETYKYLPKEQPKLLDGNTDISDNEMDEWILEWYVKIKKIENPIFIPIGFYEYMDKKGILILSKDQKIDYLKNQAVSLRHYNLAEQVKQEGEYGQSVQELAIFNSMRNDGCFSGREVIKLKNLAKQIAVFDYLKKKANENELSNMQK